MERFVKAEIISVGTELLLGKTINTDASLIAAMLADLGIDLLHIQTVGDNSTRLDAALALAYRRSDLIFTTGGLGPTDDDLTKKTIANFAGVTLREHPESLAQLKEYFGSRPIGTNQYRQALLPEGAIAFPNSIGTAPGCALVANNGKTIIMLPGPPSELLAMLEKSVRPYLQSQSHSVIHSTLIRTFGIGEGAAADKISDLMCGDNPTVAPYAQGGEMFIRVTAKADDIETAKALCAPVIREITERLGAVVYGIDVKNLEESVLSELIKQKKTIATAESCTGGLLAKRLTDLPGSSQVFGLGLVTYSNQAKEKVLAVPSALLSKYGAVSPQVARAMAINVREIAGSDLGIGITGIAGPDGGSATKPVGLVFIALATKDDCFVREMQPQGRYLGRLWVRERAASIGLDLARRFLTGLPL